MNRQSVLTALAVCATAIIAAPYLSNAGSLTPPAGPVGTSMKTLDQVEPRTPIPWARATAPDNRRDMCYVKLENPGANRR